MNAPEQDILNHLVDCHNIIPTPPEVLQVMKLQRPHRKIRVVHTCGDLCRDPRCLVNA